MMVPGSCSLCRERWLQAGRRVGFSPPNQQSGMAGSAKTGFYPQDLKSRWAEAHPTVPTCSLGKWELAGALGHVYAQAQAPWVRKGAFTEA